MKTVAVVIARMGSTRLPGKVLKPLGETNYCSLDYILHTLDYCNVDACIIATTLEERDDAIAKYARDESGRYSNLYVHRGSEEDVLDRVYHAALESNADIVVRITGDCPFIDAEVINQLIELRKVTDADMASNVDPPTWPDGLDCEVFKFSALEKAFFNAKRPSDRNTVTQYIHRNKDTFKTVNLTCPIPGMEKERWVLDTPEDFRLCREIARNSDRGWLNIKKFLDRNPRLRELNKHQVRNERFLDELVAEEPVCRSFAISDYKLGKASLVIPTGAQTFSKTKLQFPDRAPAFASHGDGGLIYDVDGNDYVDLVMGLLPAILGYRDPDVDYAIRSALGRGINLSLSTALEYELAEKLRNLIPCAEMVRFGKNGTDVTQAAVRLARRIRRWPYVASCGYHGWADVFVGPDSLRGRGVPSGVSSYTKLFNHGDESIFDELRNGIFACVIVEPETNPEFLKKLRNVCDETETILIFDEIITGFRFDIGGAQSLYGVTPDLATFGKAMGNGMPIGALVGKEKYMSRMNEICFSGTFFGETLSLAASIATIDKLCKNNVLSQLHSVNFDMTMRARVAQRCAGVDILNIGEETRRYLPRISFVPQGDWSIADIKTLFMETMIEHGVLIIQTMNFCYAHTGADCKRIFNAFTRTFHNFKEVLNKHPDEVLRGRKVPERAGMR